MFNIARVNASGVMHLVVTGEVDLRVHEEFRSAILEAVNLPAVSAVVVDLGAVPMLDSGGISVLLAGRNAAQEKRVGYEVSRARWHIRNVLDAVGVLDVLTTGSTPRPR